MLSSNTSTCINLAPTNGVCVCVLTQPVYRSQCATCPVACLMPSLLKQHLCHTQPHTKPFCMPLGHWHQDPPLLGAVSRPASILRDEALALLRFSFCFISQKCTLEAHFYDPLPGTTTPPLPFFVIGHALIKQWEGGIRKNTKLHSPSLHLLCPPLVPWRRWADSRCAGSISTHLVLSTRMEVTTQQTFMAADRKKVML